MEFNEFDKKLDDAVKAFPGDDKNGCVYLRVEEKQDEYFVVNGSSNGSSLILAKMFFGVLKQEKLFREAILNGVLNYLEQCPPNEVMKFLEPLKTVLFKGINDMFNQIGKTMAKDKPVLKENEFICAACGGVFTKAISDDEATKELKQNFGYISKKDCDLVCSNCFEKIMKGHGNDTELN